MDIRNRAACVGLLFDPEFWINSNFINYMYNIVYYHAEKMPCCFYVKINAFSRINLNNNHQKTNEAINVPKQSWQQYGKTRRVLLLMKLFQTRSYSSGRFAIPCNVHSRKEVFQGHQILKIISKGQQVELL